LSILYVSLSLWLTGLITASLRAAVGPADDRVSTMSGMMLAMTAGMMTGLIVGTGAPLVAGGDLWAATLLGIGGGLAAGLVVGAPVGMLALLDGGMAGLMGGMMGAMLGVMAPAVVVPTVLLLLTLYLLAHTGLLYHLDREAQHADAPRRSRRTRLLLLVLALVGLSVLGGLARTSAPEAQPQHHSYASTISGSPM